MTDDGAARFHFDPAYDLDRAPTIDAFVAWLRGRMKGETLEGLPRAARESHRLRIAESVWMRLASHLPFIGTTMRQRTEELCIEDAMPQIRMIHDAMREFGMDLTRHRFADMVERVVSVAVLDRAIERASETKDAVTTEVRLRPHWSAIRRELEAEAIVNLFDNLELRAEWPRMVAALRASRDEISSDEVKDQIDEVADQIERDLSSWTSTRPDGT